MSSIEPDLSNTTTTAGVSDHVGVRGCSCGNADYGAPGHDGDPDTAPARYYVLAERTEIIRYELDANSCRDAEERYLLTGDETDSKSPPMPTVVDVGFA